MNRAELEKLPSKDVVEVANDLGIKTKGKKPAELINLILDSLDGTVLDENEEETITEDSSEPSEGDYTGEEVAVETTDVELSHEEVGDSPKLSHNDKQFIKKNPDLHTRLAEEKAAFKAMPPVASPGFVGHDPKQQTAVQTHNPAIKHGQHWPTPEEVKAALKSQLARGLHIKELHDDQWHFWIDGREAAGNLKMPLNQIIFQANMLMRPTKSPTER